MKYWIEIMQNIWMDMKLTSQRNYCKKKYEYRMKLKGLWIEHLKNLKRERTYAV